MTASAHRLSLAATGRLAIFAEAGLVNWSDTQLARHLAHLHAETDELVVLAVAVGLAALRAGSVCLDLTQAHTLLPSETADQVSQGQPVAAATSPPGLASASAVTWPDPADWADRLAHSPMVTCGDGPSQGRPLRLVDGRLYLERSWDDQERVAQSIRRRLAQPPALDPAAVDRCHRLADDMAVTTCQLQATRLVLDNTFAVIGGGPGTGKTWTVARLLAVVADPDRPPRIVLTAPTGKAAARLDEAVRQNLRDLGLSRLAQAIPTAGTIHRILGIKPWGGVNYHADHPLPADLVVVDEVSMLSLHHMRLLLEAVPLSARLVLVGDPDQLASVESGAVLADLVSAQPVTPSDQPLTAEGSPTSNLHLAPYVRLEQNHRFSGDLTELARAIRDGDVAAVQHRLEASSSTIEFVPVESASHVDDVALAGLRQTVIEQHQTVLAALTDWQTTADPAALTAALAAASRHRVLCAHRQGPFGVAHWSRLITTWLSPAQPTHLKSIGQPVLVTRNDEVLGVFNGDTGVIVLADGQPRVVLPTASGPRLIGLAELDGLEPIHATTIHKAQGSQFAAVTIIVPEPSGSLLTRELLYTAVTRAQQRVRLIGSRAAVAHAVTHQALRASGLTSRLL